MGNRGFRFLGRAFAPGVLIFSLAASPAPVAAGLPAEDVKPELLRMRNQIKNAEIKLRNGIVGFQGDGAATQPPTPATVCCSSNLKHLAEAFADVREKFGGLRECYDRAGHGDGKAAVEFAKGDLTALASAVSAFERARDVSGAVGALAAITRSYNQFSASVDALPVCEPDPPASPTVPAASR